MTNKLLFLFALMTLTGFGQAVSGDITGTIFDPSGAVVPDATLTMRNGQTGLDTKAATSPEGQYRFVNLPVGTYTLTVSAPGFTPAVRKGLRIELSNTLTMNVTLPLTTSSTAVEVTDSSAGIDTTTSQVQTSYEARALTELPSAASGTGVLNLSLLGAGVASSGGVGQGTGPAVAGMRPEHNTFTVDGVSNNNHYLTGPLVAVPNDAVAEVSILQNQFSPEFGGGSGGVFNLIVKSGGNQTHGSVYEYLQNRNLKAVDALTWTQGLTSNPRYDNNRLGATVGGAIVRNKLFYFGLFEYNPIGQAAVPGAPVTAPTAAGYAMLTALPGISVNNLTTMQKYVPAAATGDAGNVSVLGKSIPVGSLSFASPVFSNAYNWYVSLDYNLSDKDQLRGRVISNKLSATDSSATFPIFWVAAPNDNKLYSISHFHNFTPTVQNELRISYNRNVNSESVPPFTFPGLSVFPQITIDELGFFMGPTGPSGSIQGLAQGQDNVTRIWGKHTLKAGYHFTDVMLTNFFIQRVRGEYEYSSLEQYLRDLTPDVFGERSAGPTSYPAGFLQHETYANDDWRVTRHLTLNLGVRYEYVTIPVASRYQSFSAPASVPGGITFAEPRPGKTDWSPRLGFAYSPGKEGTWSVRGGFSRAFDLSYAYLTSNAAPPYFQQTNDVNLNSSAPDFLKNGALSGASVPLPTDPLGARSVISSYTFGSTRPYGLTYTLGVQHTFHKDYTFEARFAGTRGVHLWNQSRLNIAPQVNSSNFIPTFMAVPSAATLAGLKPLSAVKAALVPGGTASRSWDMFATQGFDANILSYAPQGSSTYNGLAMQLNRRYSNGLQYVAAYTWSHLLDDSTATNFTTHLSPRRAQDFQNLRADWASSALDRRHRLTFTPIYDWMPFKNSKWLLRNVVGNWNFSGTFTYQSPEFATVQSNTDSNLNNDSAGDRTIINPTGAFTVGSGVTAYDAQGQKVAAGSGSTVAYVVNNPNARFIVAGPGAMANSGRNNFPLRPVNNFDVQIAKRFNIREGMRAQLTAQIFNLLNHAQYVGGFTNDVAAAGYVASRSDLVPSSASFGRFDQFYSSNSRVVQLNAKFTF